MLRRMLVIAVLASLAITAPAQTPAVKFTDTPITLHPTASPQPIGSMPLCLGYQDLRPGNRVQGLLKVFMEQDNFFKLVSSEEWYKELELPLDEFKEKSKYRTTVSNGMAYSGDKYVKMMGYLDRGARFKSIEWNEYFELRQDGYYLLLPEVQKIRSLAAAVRMRVRNEIVTGDFQKAAVSVQTLFGLAEALEKHPCLIASLVSLSITNIAIKSIEEMISQPGCPNLFWSLADLPNPIVNQRMAVGGERLFLHAQFAPYLTTERALSEKEIDTALSEINEILKLEDQRGGEFPVIRSAKVRFALVVADEARITACRERLIKNGANADVVKSMPAMQIAIRDEFDRFTALQDDYFKAYLLPFHQAQPWMKKTEDAMKKAKAKGDILGPAMVPAVMKSKLALAKADQRIAQLRALEAIRLYAHENKGKLPATLAETGLPLLTDPYTDKELNYVVNGDTATLSGADNLMGGNIKYDIRIAK